MYLPVVRSSKNLAKAVSFYASILIRCKTKIKQKKIKQLRVLVITFFVTFTRLHIRLKNNKRTVNQFYNLNLT